MSHAQLEVDSLLTEVNREEDDPANQSDPMSEAWDPTAEAYDDDANEWDDPANEAGDYALQDSAEFIDDPLSEGDRGEDPEWQNQSDNEALAYELMTVDSDTEMEEFLGKLLRRAGRGLKRIGRQALPTLMPLLKGPAGQLLKRAMPLLGSSLGSVVPGAGTILGGMAGQKVAQLLGGNMESASDDEARLDLSKRLVNTVSGAMADAISSPLAAAEPVAAVRDSLVNAMRTHLPPGVRRALASQNGQQKAMSGRWFRRGGQIILVGL